jgi:hypothetical protein
MFSEQSLLNHRKKKSKLINFILLTSFSTQKDLLWFSLESSYFTGLSINYTASCHNLQCSFPLLDKCSKDIKTKRAICLVLSNIVQSPNHTQPSQQAGDILVKWARCVTFVYISSFNSALVSIDSFLLLFYHLLSAAKDAKGRLKAAPKIVG